MRRISSQSDIDRSIEELRDLKEARFLEQERLFEMEFSVKNYVDELNHWVYAIDHGNCPGFSSKRTKPGIPDGQTQISMKPEIIMATSLDLSDFMEE